MRVLQSYYRAFGGTKEWWNYIVEFGEVDSIFTGSIEEFLQQLEPPLDRPDFADNDKGISDVRVAKVDNSNAFILHILINRKESRRNLPKQKVVERIQTVAKEWYGKKTKIWVMLEVGKDCEDCDYYKGEKICCLFRKVLDYEYDKDNGIPLKLTPCNECKRAKERM